jgi:hypothetical protein
VWRDVWRLAAGETQDVVLHCGASAAVRAAIVPYPRHVLVSPAAAGQDRAR